MAHFFIKSNYQWCRLPLNQVCWVTKSTLKKNYLVIHLEEESFEVKMTLTKALEIFPISDFLRVHNSFIVQIDKVTSIHQGFDYLKIHQKRIPIGEFYLPELKKRCYLIK